MTELLVEELRLQLSQLVGDVLSADVDPSNLDAKLVEDYGANSMDMVDIVERIERKHSVKVANDRVLELKTFGEVVNVVLEQKISKG